MYRGKKGTVLSVRKEKADVQFDALRMEVPIRELVIVEDVDTPVSIHTIEVSHDQLPAVFELHVRGMRLDEALDALEKQLDGAITNGFSQFRIIHGLGEGILQKGIHNYLLHDVRVKRFFFAAPEDGGMGKTIVELGRD